ncbi:hypothetical protein [Chromobacterium haemolyticum]|uniref:hypothetical protein n=1 Tax=Chromobacterium haemolyticum TaxID=394935 RepID=UPI001319380D|nr:hypothetical protein [Chromobacterium haemolyticum]BBH12945.1 hypothetical protein CH06BL_21930 [Chromobacterium haemolyticum]
MKIITFVVGVVLGAAVMFVGMREIGTPAFWRNPIKLTEVQFVSPETTVFKTQEMKDPAFAVKTGTRCYVLEDRTSSFARIDSKDGTALEMLVVCPGLGAGWTRRL